MLMQNKRNDVAGNEEVNKRTHKKRYYRQSLIRWLGNAQWLYDYDIKG